MLLTIESAYGIKIFLFAVFTSLSSADSSSINPLINDVIAAVAWVCILRWVSVFIMLTRAGIKSWWYFDWNLGARSLSKRPVDWRASYLTLGFSCWNPETLILATSSRLLKKDFLQASEIYPKNTKPMHFSFQSGLSIAPFTKAVVHINVVFSPKKTVSL